MPQRLSALAVMFLWIIFSGSVSRAYPLAPLPSSPLSPSPYHLVSISQILSGQAKVETVHGQVLLIGHVLQRFGDDTYLFTDGTGAIKLDSEDFQLQPGKAIVVAGRIDHGFLGMGGVTIVVQHWRDFNGGSLAPPFTP